ncbi:hypothetical protein G3480_09835 [Thiorhodococcus mannitoliphagus]|uniref:DUF4412 domain-containing protein n=1 Tax=Thiorhodococcus mannitoliphagus TaxID=329406 RepID=A0A6P1DY13_9GAMM|nr:hypothetical protein [Thiorhodococcus mannitoliphagus]NEX20604.1 hypothetical protein [Thiorhodococcus mannitoliphagus]
MRIHKRLQLAAVLGAALTVSAQAEIAGVEFSADMVSRGPDGESTTGKMFVGDDRMRVEMSQQGLEMVRITDQEKGMEWILFPEQKGYMERPIPADSKTEAPMSPPSAETSPCEGVPGLTCRKVGQEEVAGRPAIKWEMVVERDGQSATGVQWIDVERGLPLKYQMPNGQAMELAMLGSETIGGRSVEKWQMTTTVPDKQPVQTFQWYDPELKLSVREEFPGGFVRELDNIQIGSQPDGLFQVPADYTKMEQPPQR